MRSKNFVNLHYTRTGRGGGGPSFSDPPKAESGRSKTHTHKKPPGWLTHARSRIQPHTLHADDLQCVRPSLVRGATVDVFRMILGRGRYPEVARLSEGDRGVASHPAAQIGDQTTTISLSIMMHFKVLACISSSPVRAPRMIPREDFNSSGGSRVSRVCVHACVYVMSGAA